MKRQEFDDKRLHLNLPLVLFLFGMLSCLVGLISPAVKYGKILTGFELNSISTIVAFLGSSKGESSSERTFMCRVLLIANCFAPLMLILGNRFFKHAPYLGNSVFGILTLCVLFLAIIPLSEIEHVYWGYYFWLVGLILIGLTGLSNLHTGRN